MQLGMIGSGRMDASVVRRLLTDGHACMVHDVQPTAVVGPVKDGATGAASLKEMVSQLGRPRTIWLMVPAAVVDRALGDLLRSATSPVRTLYLYFVTHTKWYSI